MCATAAKSIVITGTAAGFARLPPLPTLRDLIKLYKLQAAKQLSQNFLLDEKVTNKIVKAAGKIDGLYVCEVGPGPGGITRSILAKGARKVILIEKDTRFKQLMDMLSEACPGRVETHWGDVLSFNLSTLFPEETRVPWESDRIPPIRVIGNLPFNVATPLIIKWLKCISEKTNVWTYGRVPLTLTFQHEVAERLAADIMDAQRCRLSIMAQYLCTVRHKFTIDGKAFLPKPDVDVGVVTCTPLVEPQIKQPFHVVEKVVRHIVHLKHKPIVKGAGELFPSVLRRELSARMVDDAQLRYDNLPLRLSVEEYGRLCDAYVKICEEYPVAEYNYRGCRSDEIWESYFGETYGYSKTENTYIRYLSNIKRKLEAKNNAKHVIDYSHTDDHLVNELETPEHDSTDNFTDNYADNYKEWYK